MVRLSNRGSGGQWEGQGDGRALGYCALQVDITAMDGGDPFADGETESAAAVVTTSGRVHAVKPVEDMRQIRLGHAEARIPYGEFEVAGVAGQGDGNMTVGRIFQGIVGEVQKKTTPDFWWLK